MRYKTGGTPRLFPCSFTSTPTVVSGYQDNLGGAGVNFNWLNGFCFSDITVSSITDHTYSGESRGPNHWIMIGY